MLATAQISTKVTPELKKQAERVANDLGLNLSDAVRIFLKDFVDNYGFSFSIARNKELKWDDLNEETKKSLSDGEYEVVNDIKDIWK
ncbi:MAG: type II toxin-antitoxin system RelB/DinJ family antitoxin [Rickettsiales bacterium]|jgi:addiction module RelB/DinJ family antitoxin|nr:type II toxin-antitoxin system RelB/DinJ family antitoxin [Rickettsiales bacterium]